MKKVTINFIYNSIYQLLLIVLPIITIPYISRVLNVADIGTYSYTFSIVKYFTFFAMLGLQNYGNRSIAVVRDDREKLNKTFTEIFIMQVITTLLVTIIFFLFILFSETQYKNNFYIQSLMLISCFFDVSWFFFGMEKFKITVTRNIIIKLLTVFFILVFVKTPNDLWIYTLIMSMGVFLSNIILYITLFRFVNFVPVNIRGILSHLKPNLLLFVPVLAISIYRLLAKVMLGSISGVFELGLFENVDKIIDIPMGFITALGLVMLPHMSNLLKKNSKEELNEVIEKSLIFVMFMSSAFTFGMIGISSNFIPIFLGKKFEGAVVIMNITAPVLLFKAWANVIRTQYLIPREKYYGYTISLVIGASVNIILNMNLIQLFGAKGTAYSVLVTEIVVCLVQSWFMKNQINTKRVLSYTSFFVFLGIFMLIIVRYIYIFLGAGILTLFIQIIVGALMYIGIGFVYYKKRISVIYG